MCRSIAEGGRRCRGGGGGNSPTKKSSPAKKQAGRKRTTRQPANRPPAANLVGNATVGNPSVDDTAVNAAPVDDTATREATTTDAPALNPATPQYNKLLTTSPEEWFALPWTKRKQDVEAAFHEVKRFTGTEVTWGGWNRRVIALGETGWSQNRWTGEISKPTIKFSEATMRTVTSVNVADTIAHELAHARLPHGAGHGTAWHEEFAAVKTKLGLDTEITTVHQHNEAERAQAVKVAEEKRAKPPVWLGTCPQGHRFGKARNPKYTYSCVECRRNGKPADITYHRNTGKETL